MNSPLHEHPLFSTVDVYNQGWPTNSANLPEGVENCGNKQHLPVSSSLRKRIFRIPFMKHFDKELIDQYVSAIKKVCNNYYDLLEGDSGGDDIQDAWNLTKRKI